MRIETIETEKCTIRVHIPELSAEERERRENLAKEALKRFFMAIEREKYENNKWLLFDLRVSKTERQKEKAVI